MKPLLQFFQRGAALLAVFLAACTVPAELPPDDRAAIEARVRAYVTAHDAQDYKSQLRARPPALLRLQAARAGRSVEGYVAQQIADWTSVQHLVSIGPLQLRLSKLRPALAPSGAVYATIPASRQITGEESFPETHRMTLIAVKDDTPATPAPEWYLAAIRSQRDLNDLIKAYPELDGIKPRIP